MCYSGEYTLEEMKKKINGKGGIAYSKDVTDAIKERVEFIAPVTVYPGEDELLALTQGGLRVLKGEEKAKQY